MLASSLCADHQRQYWTPKDPEARLEAELGSRVRTLHEWDPGARVQAPRQEGVQSGCQSRQYQLDGNKLACASSAKAACQQSSPRFQVSWVDSVLPNGHGNRNFPESSQKVSQIFKRNGPREITSKHKRLLYWRLRMQWGTCPVRAVPRNNSKGIILLLKLIGLREESHPDT